MDTGDMGRDFAAIQEKTKGLSDAQKRKYYRAFQRKWGVTVREYKSSLLLAPKKESVEPVKPEEPDYSKFPSREFLEKWFKEQGYPLGKGCFMPYEEAIKKDPDLVNNYYDELVDYGDVESFWDMYKQVSKVPIFSNPSSASRP